MEYQTLLVSSISNKGNAPENTSGFVGHWDMEVATHKNQKEWTVFQQRLMDAL